ncbi:Hypothetical predicted protein [Pelobates cultripes]|uniref:Uncharacterized protein n=1 Tax=Pelobates cultripes TaxID=61616 RepID=A0AAD1WQT7_PELCU|nr:Hypothetical predicted protein [Pelobates cultripes]
MHIQHPSLTITLHILKLSLTVTLPIAPVLTHVQSHRNIMPIPQNSLTYSHHALPPALTHLQLPCTSPPYLTDTHTPLHNLLIPPVTYSHLVHSPSGQSPTATFHIHQAVNHPQPPQAGVELERHGAHLGTRF